MAERADGRLRKRAARQGVRRGARPHALREVSFDLRIGEFAAIVGQSARAIDAAQPARPADSPTGGTVRYRDIDAETLRVPRPGLRNELIGFVFQSHYLLPEFSVYGLSRCHLKKKTLPEGRFVRASKRR
jgi:lipoprotein-releasing system ATP-binding protein